MELIQKGIAVKTFNLGAAATGIGTPFALPARAGSLMWQTFFGTNPTVLAIALEFSLDNIHWDAIDASVVLEGEIRTFSGIGGALGFVRGNITSITGGAEVTMIIAMNDY